MIAAMARRGFSMGHIREALARWEEENPTEEEQPDWEPEF